MNLGPDETGHTTQDPEAMWQEKPKTKQWPAFRRAIVLAKHHAAVRRVWHRARPLRAAFRDLPAPWNQG